MPEQQAQHDQSNAAARRFDATRKLISRREAAEMLGKSVATVMRLEKDGRLTPVRLTNRPQSMVSLRLAEVLAIVEGQADDAS